MTDTLSNNIDELILIEKFPLEENGSKSPFESSLEWENIRTLRQSWGQQNKGKKIDGNKEYKQFLKDHIPNLDISQLSNAKNLFNLQQEIKAHVSTNNPFRLLSIEELNFLNSLIELLENIENTQHIQELYRLRKRTTGDSKNSGISPHEADKIKNCIKQGRELYLSGKNGALMVKPLNFFYSITAYAFAVIILNNPIRYSLTSLPRSHGINYALNEMRDGEQNNIKNAKIQFGGNVKQGTFSELFTSFPTFHIYNKNVDIVQDNEESILAFYKNRATTNIGTLLSMIPEIREYYNLVTGQNSKTHPLEINLSSNARNGGNWEFQIGDGEKRPDEEDIKNAFGSFNKREQNGRIIITIPFQEARNIKATIYSDIRGRFWYIENPFYPIILPEICTHFLLTNAFSNIMRYSPDYWGEILSNQLKSNTSLIIRKYLSSFEDKFPTLLLRSASKFYPYVTSES